MRKFKITGTITLDDSRLINSTASSYQMTDPIIGWTDAIVKDNNNIIIEINYYVGNNEYPATARSYLFTSVDIVAVSTFPKTINDITEYIQDISDLGCNLMKLVSGHENATEII